MSDAVYSPCCSEGNFSLLTPIERAVITGLLETPPSQLRENMWVLEVLVDKAVAQSIESMRLKTLKLWRDRMAAYCQDFATQSNKSLADQPGLAASAETASSNR